MPALSHEELKRCMDLVVTVGEAIRELTKVSPNGGAISGELYARLMAKGVDLETYNSLIGVLKNAGLVKEVGHILVWIGD